MTKRLLVLGGGRHQVPLIRRAEERGIEVVLLDYLPDAPGRAFATHDLLQDALDIEAATATGRRLGISGVTTTGTDLAVVAMAAVAEALGLPCYLNLEGARTATDKTRMAAALGAAGLNMARKVELGPDDPPPRLPFPFPVVVKPADSQGQRGVTTVTGASQLGAAAAGARSHSATDRVIIEEFLVGPEFTANAWMSDGETRLLAVNDRVTYNPPPVLGVAFQHVYPSKWAAGRLDESARIMATIGEAYCMRNGPLYVQMIGTESGPVVVEAAARVGGGHESAMFPLIIGEGVEDRLIDLALDGTCSPVAHDERHSDGNSSVLVNFVLGSAGQVHSIAPLPHGDGVVDAQYYIRPGQVLGDVSNSLGRIGFFVVQGVDRRDALSVAASYYESLRVEDSSGRNLVLVPNPDYLNAP